MKTVYENIWLRSPLGGTLLSFFFRLNIFLKSRILGIRYAKNFSNGIGISHTTTFCDLHCITAKSLHYFEKKKNHFFSFFLLHIKLRRFAKKPTPLRKFAKTKKKLFFFLFFTSYKTSQVCEFFTNVRKLNRQIRRFANSVPQLVNFIFVRM